MADIQEDRFAKRCCSDMKGTSDNISPYRQSRTTGSKGSARRILLWNRLAMATVVTMTTWKEKGGGSTGKSELLSFQQIICFEFDTKCSY